MRNPVWFSLVCIVGIATLIFTGKTLYHLYIYHSLKSETVANQINWSIKEIADERYLLQADYSFSLGEKSVPVTGRTIFENLIFRNPKAAEKKVTEFKEKRWIVWFDPNNPNHSSLQKDFPFKELVYMMILWGLTLYFFWIRRYDRNRSQT